VETRIIAVVGGGRASLTVLANAGNLGAEIARMAILLTGGDGSDPTTVKDAAVLGARAACASSGISSRIISILQEPGGLAKGSCAQGSCTIRSGLKHGRNVLNAVAADAMIVLEGMEGTLSEAAFAQMTGRRVILFGGAERNLAGALLKADFGRIATQAASQQEVLPVLCNATNVKKYAGEALANGFKTSNVQQAVAYAVAAPLLASLPPLAGVDPDEYQCLLKKFGR
jgi:predicted Rossmann-fold nucleotide-binding protein